VRPDLTHALQAGLRERSASALPSRQTLPGVSGQARRPMNGNRHPKRTGWKPAPDHPWRHMPVGKAKPHPASRERTESLNA
jgi:hypothetical protein